MDLLWPVETAYSYASQPTAYSDASGKKISKACCLPGHFNPPGINIDTSGQFFWGASSIITWRFVESVSLRYNVNQDCSGSGSYYSETLVILSGISGLDIVLGETALAILCGASEICPYVVAALAYITDAGVKLNPCMYKENEYWWGSDYGITIGLRLTLDWSMTKGCNDTTCRFNAYMTCGHSEIHLPVSCASPTASSGGGSGGGGGNYGGWGGKGSQMRE